MLAEKGDEESALLLARQTGEITATLQTMADNGNRNSALTLAKYAKDLSPLKALASEGDYEAAHVLAEKFDDQSYLNRLAKEDDYVVAYERYQILRSEDTVGLTAWRLLCSAANAGYSKAQAEVGNWHRTAIWESWRSGNEDKLRLLRKVGFRPDDQIAYMWYTLAMSNGDESVQYSRDFYVADVLTEREIAQAEQFAREWKPGGCPSKEHRLGRPGAT